MARIVLMMAMMRDPKAAVPCGRPNGGLGVTVSVPIVDLSRVKYQVLTAMAMMSWPMATMNSDVQ